MILLSWAPGLGAPYQYDDFVTPVSDPASQSLRSWAGAVPRTLRPLTKLTFAAESSLGLRRAPHRRWLNASLFLMAVVLLALLARKAGLSETPALALATVWAVHPVHAEAVIALAGRSVLLSSTLMLASAFALLARQRAVAVLLAILALLSRETAWPWLVVAAGWAAWGTGGDRSRLRTFTAAAVAVVGGGALVLASSRMRELMASGIEDPSALNRLGLQWAALPQGLTLWLLDPSAFTVDMQPPPAGLARLPWIALAVGLYAGALWLALRRGSRPPLRVAALLWFCSVLPLHSVVPKLDPLTARVVSASSAALVLALACAGAWALPSLHRWRGLGIASWGLAAGVGFGLVTSTHARAGLYRDPVALWTDAAARSRTTTRPLINLATLLVQKGRLDDAGPVLREALRRDPRSFEAGSRLEALGTLIETRELLIRGGNRP